MGKFIQSWDFSNKYKILENYDDILEGEVCGFEPKNENLAEERLTWHGNIQIQEARIET